MSLRLISRSADLKKLRDEGYDVSIKGAYLVIRDVPYVGPGRVIRRGVIVSALTLAGDVTTTPDSHVVYFAGDYPRDKHGNEIEQIRHQSSTITLLEDLVVNHSFSSKPASGGYANYHEKISTYVAIISNEATSVDPTVSAKALRVIEPDEAESVFAYLDTASSRADINQASRKLEGGRVAIVGLGGTGSYVLDLVAKTPAGEIHLFDGDDLLTHNAFRSPGAATIDELRHKPRKVAYYAQRYSAIHRHVVPHDYAIDAGNINDLDAMDFVFLCMDRGPEKRVIVEHLEKVGKAFIDVGMGLEIVDESIGGIARVVLSTNEQRAHVWERHRIPFTNPDDDNIYSKNIQVADLNALNATLAVIKWKKLRGFYRDLAHEHYSTYTVDGNRLMNGDFGG